jgi:hypothetical protein
MACCRSTGTSRVAWGRDYADVTPVRGVMIGPATTQHLYVSVDVQRV